MVCTLEDGGNELVLDNDKALCDSAANRKFHISLWLVDSLRL
jgi:hypothetical protein